MRGPLPDRCGTFNRRSPDSLDSDSGPVQMSASGTAATPASSAFQQTATSARPQADGTPPEDFAEEARQAWRNAWDALRQAGASMTDIFSVRVWLTDTSPVRGYVDMDNTKPPETPGWFRTIESTDSPCPLDNPAYISERV
jgi:hypothetical protein